jgi:hypothetical protein
VSRRSHVLTLFLLAVQQGLAGAEGLQQAGPEEVALVAREHCGEVTVVTAGSGASAREEWAAQLLAGLLPAGSTPGCRLELREAHRSIEACLRGGAGVLLEVDLVLGPLPRIFALGDLHGDLEPARAILQAVGLVDGAGRWSGSQDILVQCGDVVDRGEDTLALLLWLRQLEREATAAGGRVILLLGNHEAMALQGVQEYATGAELAAFDGWGGEDLPEGPGERRGAPEHARALAPDGELGSWLLEHDAVVRLGNTLLLHGGLSRRALGWSIPELNEGIRESLRPGSTPGPEHRWLLGPEGPLWFRGYAATRESPELRQTLEVLLEQHRARRMVVGHTRQEQITERYQERVYLIDTGLSGYYQGEAEILEVDGDRVIAHRLESRLVLDGVGEGEER